MTKRRVDLLLWKQSLKKKDSFKGHFKRFYSFCTSISKHTKKRYRRRDCKKYYNLYKYSQYYKAIEKTFIVPVPYFHADQTQYDIYKDILTTMDITFTIVNKELYCGEAVVDFLKLHPDFRYTNLRDESNLVGSINGLKIIGFDQNVLPVNEAFYENKYTKELQKIKFKGLINHYGFFPNSKYDNFRFTGILD